jgi:hypothetical protein
MPPSATGHCFVAARVDFAIEVFGFRKRFGGFRQCQPHATDTPRMTRNHPAELWRYQADVEPDLASDEWLAKWAQNAPTGTRSEWLSCLASG